MTNKERRRRERKAKALQVRLALLPRKYGLRWLGEEVNKHPSTLSRTFNGSTDEIDDVLLQACELVIEDAEKETGGARSARLRNRVVRATAR